ncbi:hypothetical protein, partial [Bilophila wadsworthia]|uniref:hypothetical protein n=1 Tax=Bilophila wadsworthia TaxID=35833 RepID=UPI003AB77483
DPRMTSSTGTFFFTSERPPTPNLPAPLKDFDLIEPPMKALQKTKPVKEFLQRAIILAKSSAGTNSRRAASPISFTLP